MFVHILGKTDVVNVYFAKEAAIPLNHPLNHIHLVFSKDKLLNNTTYSAVPKHSWHGDFEIPVVAEVSLT